MADGVDSFPRQVPWSSFELLEGVGLEHITASTEVRTAAHQNLHADMCAEHDAEFLWAHLNDLGFHFSRKFSQSLHAWRMDERNHYVGLRRIYSLLYATSQDSIDLDLQKRKPNFSLLTPFLADEFRMCVVLAYDELVSAKGYKMFFDAFKKFGPREFAIWVRFAARDEALHAQNFIDVVRRVHPRRVAEVRPVIQEILAYEARPEMAYNATFLLDHTPDKFSAAFLTGCAATIVAQFESRGP